MDKDPLVIHLCVRGISLEQFKLKVKPAGDKFSYKIKQKCTIMIIIIKKSFSGKYASCIANLPLLHGNHNRLLGGIFFLENMFLGLCF